MADSVQPQTQAWESEMFRLLAENVKDYAIFIVDPQRHILTWNKGAERLLGFTEEEITGRKCDCFFTPEDVQRGIPQKELDEALHTGRGDDDRWHMRKDGSRFWASGTVTPLRSEGGMLRGFAKIMRDRTELKLAEEAARERERQLHLLTDHAPVLIAHCDTERRYKFVNKPYAVRFGLHPREVVGRHICDVLGGPAYSAIERYVDMVLTGERVEFEVEIPYDGQGPQTMRCSYDPEFDADGRVEGFVAAIVNVTESRRAEAALAANRRRLQAIFDTTQDAILLADDQARYVDANPAACTLLGYNREELLRRGVFDITWPPDAGAGRNAWEAFLRDGKQSGEYEVSRKDGTRVVVEFRAVANVQPGLHLLVLRDVTERKRAEAVLRQSEALLHRILGSNAIGLIVADFRGNVVQANDAFLEIIGYDRADLDAGRVNFVALTPEEYRPLDERAVDEMKRAGRHAPFEKEYVRKDGSRVPVLVGTAYLGGKHEDDRGIGFIIDLTEQKRASAALRESEERLRTLSDNLPQGAIYQTLGDLEGRRRFLYISAGVERLFGVTPAEALADAHTLYGLVHEGDRLRVAAAEEVALRGHFPFDCEFRSWTRTGELRWAHARSAPRRIPTGETVWEGIILDVTARRRAEEALRESEARFRAIFDQTIAGVAQTDLTGRLVLVNQRYCEIVRRPADELYGLRMQDITHPDDLPHNVELFAGMVQGGQPFVIEKRYALPDGSHVWVNNSVSLVRDEAGQPKYTVAVVLDVTERKRAEQERERLTSVIEYSPDFIGIAGPDQRPLFLNRAGQRLVGLDGMEEARRTVILDYFPEDERERVQRDIMPVLLEKGHWDGEIDFRHFRTGEHIPMRWNVFTLPDPATGQPGFFACVSRDVTEQRRAMEALRDADRRKDEFLATLAHELRNPLAPLRNGLQVMKLAAGDAGAVEQARTMMERQLAQMVRLIDDLLDVSRITRGKLQLRRERVELVSVVRAAVETARPLIEASAHQLTVTLLPEQVYLDGDPTRLAQVFSNLLTNAAKYSDRGGHIRLTAQREDGEIVVSVKDTGIGIAPEHLTKLFEMFSQVDTALERSQGGLGIGLALVRGLVEMHGGTIEARSEGLGRGSEFIVRLPMMMASTALDTQQSAGAEDAPGRHCRRILIADDNRDAADSLAVMLRLGGHEVHAVHDGHEAVAAAEWFRPDVTLLDIGMPKFNGLQVARHIRQQSWGRRIILVAITGWGQEDDKRRATEAGFDHHLTKPVEPAALEMLLASPPANQGERGPQT